MQDSQKPSLVRLVYMILFSIIGRFVSVVVFFAAIFQFVYAWIYDAPNEKVLKFTGELAEFAKEIVSYIGFNTEEKPWPLGEWPKN
ncbi:MAG: DUF4389 domain-containing protein [Epsilonproteobacteria bacterium]|nr:DUF4389 domain-containing protein [Campylobacterota bacterium]